MYAIPNQKQRYESARLAASRVLARVQYEYVRATELAAGHRNLTALERLELASLCSALAEAFSNAAAIWQENASVRVGLVRSFQQEAERFRDDAELHAVMAEIAPAVPGEDPFRK